MQCRAQQGELGSTGLGDSGLSALIRIACTTHRRARSRATTPVKTRADTLVHRGTQRMARAEWPPGAPIAGPGVRPGSFAGVKQPSMTQSWSHSKTCGALRADPGGRPREEEPMSSAVSARPPGGQHRDPELTPTKDQPKTGALGLTSATMLVIGTVIGAGGFTMPAVLASAGTISLAVLAVIAVGAMVLAILFGQLTRRIPNSDGGLYAYARYEFGDFAGYLTGWCYWVQAWAGNAAIVSSWVFYCDALFGINPSGLGNWGIALVGLWIPAGINLAGLRQTAWIQKVTVGLKYLPLLFVAVVGWFFISKANFGAFNASGGSLYSAIGIAAGVALFSFIGVETAAITAKRVKDPRRNVGRASLLGTGAAAIVYLAVSPAGMGLEAGRRAGRGVRVRGADRLDPGHRRGVPGTGQ